MNKGPVRLSGSARAVRRIGRASSAERALLAEAAASLALARLAVRVLPFRLIAARLGAQMEETGAASGPARQELDRIRWAIGAVSARVPWRAKCLEQALAGHAMLRRRHVPNTVYLGVARTADERSPLDAHAWLRSGTVQVTGGGHVERYAVLATFAHRPAGEP